MDVHTQIGLIGLAWLAVVIAFQQYSMLNHLPTLGAPLAFLLIMSLNHLGALVHADPTYDHRRNLFLAELDYSGETVVSGFSVSFLGIFAFALGVILVDYLVRRPSARPRPTGGARAKPGAPPVLRHRDLTVLEQFILHSKFFVLVGLTGYILPLLIPDFPGAAALLGSIRLAYVAGVLGMIFCYRRNGMGKAAFRVMAMGSAAPPLFGLLSDGIFGDTVAEAFVIFAFYIGLIRPNYKSVLKATLLLAVASYAVFFLSVVWMTARDEVRSNIWSNSGLVDRVEITLSSLSKATKNIDNEEMQYFFDMRLNQNIFIGKSVEMFEIGVIQPEEGRTLLQAVIAWIPRAFWPDKPKRGGSDFIDKYTGKSTDGNVSYGVGQILEFYVNFKIWGVFFGMAAYGMLLRALDVRAAIFLRQGMIRHSAPWTMAVIPLVTALNTFFFLVNEVIVTVIIGLILKAAALNSVKMVQSIWPARRHRQSISLRPR